MTEGIRMARIGVIGTGSMGGMLIRKFVETGAFPTGDVLASNRSPDKVRAVAAVTGIRIADSNLDLAAASDVIFICVKPLEVKPLLKELRGVLAADKLLVSIASDVTIRDISALCDARVARVIPSVTSECSKGVSLVTFGDNSTEADRHHLLSALGCISQPVETEERHLELLADLTSCAPAFIASIIHEFALSATRRESISPEFAELLVMETLAGTAELLKNVNSFEEVVMRVATKGGITEEGVKVIRNVVPSMYDELMEVTLAKHRLVKERIRDQAA